MNHRLSATILATISADRPHQTGSHQDLAFGVVVDLAGPAHSRGHRCPSVALTAISRISTGSIGCRPPPPTGEFSLRGLTSNGSAEEFPTRLNAEVVIQT